MRAVEPSTMQSLYRRTRRLVDIDAVPHDCSPSSRHIVGGGANEPPRRRAFANARLPAQITGRDIKLERVSFHEHDAVPVCTITHRRA